MWCESVLLMQHKLGEERSERCRPNEGQRVRLKVFKTETYKMKFIFCVKVLRRERTQRKCHSEVLPLKVDILIYFIKIGLKCSVKLMLREKSSNCLGEKSTH